MVVFAASNARGTGISKGRRDLLEAAAKLGVIEYATNLPGATPRQFTQYVVRVAGVAPGEAAPWRVLDGREVLPWLLGIAEARTTADDYTGPALLELLAPHMTAADPVPAELAGAQ